MSFWKFLLWSFLIFWGVGLVYNLIPLLKNPRHRAIGEKICHWFIAFVWTSGVWAGILWYFLMFMHVPIGLIVTIIAGFVLFIFYLIWTDPFYADLW